MTTFLITAAVFTLAMLAFSLSVLAGRARHECSCKKAARVMKEYEQSGCDGCPEADDREMISLGKKDR